MLLHLQKKRGTKYFPDVLNYLNNEKSQNFKKMHPATLIIISKGFMNIVLTQREKKKNNC